MSRELRVTLAIVIGVLVIASPAIFAAPAAAPSNYSYLAAVFHILPPTPTPCQDEPEDCADYATDAAVDAMTATADVLTATALVTPIPGTPTLTPTKTSVPPIGTKVMPSPTSTPTPKR